MDVRSQCQLRTTSSNLIWAVRPAVPDDADAACKVLRASITTLCSLDHDNDPVILERWLANKTPDNVRHWIESNPPGFFVAHKENLIGGVGSVQADGYILLNYVAPWGRSEGIGKMLMAAMEGRAAANKLAVCTLKSTATAHGFYRSLGYEDVGAPVPSFGRQPAYPMRRWIGVSTSPTDNP